MRGDFLCGDFMRKRIDTKKVVGIPIFSSLAVIVALVCQVIPPIAGFLSLDVKDAAIAIASFVYGPLSAVIIAFRASFIEFLTFSTTGWYGLIMNILSSATFCVVTGMIYKYKRSFYGAVAALVSGVFSVTAVMMLANLFITPLYLTMIGVPSTMGDVAKMIPTILLPFNFLKSTLNAAIVLLIYKPISKALKKAHVTEVIAVEEKKQGNYKKTAVITAVSISIIVLSIVLIFTVLNG